MTDTEETGHDSEIKNQDDLALVERMQEGRDKIVAEIKKVIIGQEDIIDELLLFCIFFKITRLFSRKKAYWTPNYGAAPYLFTMNDY